MLVASVYTCENRFSYTPLRRSGNYVEGEYSRAQIMVIVNDYKSNFQRKRYSVLKLLLVDIKADTGEVEVLETLSLKNELAKKTVINPAKKAKATLEKARDYQQAPADAGGEAIISVQDTPLFPIFTEAA